jgi:hypothetical protein
MLLIASSVLTIHTRVGCPDLQSRNGTHDCDHKDHRGYGGRDYGNDPPMTDNDLQEEVHLDSDSGGVLLHHGSRHSAAVGRIDSHYAEGSDLGSAPAANATDYEIADEEAGEVPDENGRHRSADHRHNAGRSDPAAARAWEEEDLSDHRSDRPDDRPDGDHLLHHFHFHLGRLGAPHRSAGVPRILQ